MKEDIEIIEKDNNISPKDSILAKKDFVKAFTDEDWYFESIRAAEEEEW